MHKSEIIGKHGKGVPASIFDKPDGTWRRIPGTDLIACVTKNFIQIFTDRDTDTPSFEANINPRGRMSFSVYPHEPEGTSHPHLFPAALIAAAEQHFRKHGYTPRSIISRWLNPDVHILPESTNFAQYTKQTGVNSSLEQKLDAAARTWSGKTFNALKFTPHHIKEVPSSTHAGLLDHVIAIFRKRE